MSDRVKEIVAIVVVAVCTAILTIANAADIAMGWWIYVVAGLDFIGAVLGIEFVIPRSAQKVE